MSTTQAAAGPGTSRAPRRGRRGEGQRQSVAGWLFVTPTLVVLGLFLAVKQYAVLALPLALLIGRPPMSLGGLRRTVVPAVVVAAAVTLPLALGDLPSFLRAVVTLQFDQPFRPEALSYLGIELAQGEALGELDPRDLPNVDPRRG